MSELLSADYVADEEILYRRVHTDIEGMLIIVNGEFRLSSQAFNDPFMQPSVNRCELHQSDATKSKVRTSDAVAGLKAMEVRAIRPLIQRDSKGNTIGEYTVDISPKPSPKNIAHAIIHSDPPMEPASASRVFKHMKEALAQLATWAIPPATFLIF